MKFNKGLMILTAAFALGLVACNNSTSESEFVPTSPSQSGETSQSESSSEGTSSEESSSEEQSSEEQSSEEQSSEEQSSEEQSSEESSSQEEQAFSGKVEFFNGAETTPLTSIKEMSGAKNAKVTLENLPEGKTLADYKLVLPRQSALVTLVDDSDAQGDYTFQIVPMAAGVFKGVVKVMDGENVALEIPYNLPIEADLTLDGYVALDKAKIIELNGKTGGDNGRYYLASDIDMEGTALSASQLTFTGSIYGAGHTIRNFSVTNESGIFFSFQGVAYDINLEGEVKAGGAAWAGLLAKETSWRSVVSNVRAIVADNEAAPTDEVGWTWARNGGLVGMTRGLIQDCLVDVTNCKTDRTMPFSAYSDYVVADNYEMDKDNAFIDNCYTNAKESITMPFDPDPNQPWFTAPNPDSKAVSGIVWTSAAVSTYKLDASIWNVVAGQIPTLIVK